MPYSSTFTGAQVDSAVNTVLNDLGTASLKDAGSANGVADLDNGGKVPIAELPVGTGSTQVCAGNDSRVVGALPSGGGTMSGRLTIGPISNTQSALTYSATTNIDFDGDPCKTVSITGNITFTTSNRAAGKMVKIRIVADSSTRNLTFPAWVFVGGAAPTTIAASKTAILSLECFGTADTDIVAAYAVQS
jgi:hypothetical protein